MLTSSLFVRSHPFVVILSPAEASAWISGATSRLWCPHLRTNGQTPGERNSRAFIHSFSEALAISAHVSPPRTTTPELSGTSFPWL